MRLSGHGAQATDLPKKPFLDLDACALVRRIELPELATEILEDGAGIKHRDRFAAGAIGIDNCRHTIVRGDLQEFRRELLPLTDVDVLDLVGNAEFLEHDADLPAVGGPVIKLNRVPS